MRNEHAIKIYDQIAEEYSRRYDPIESEEDLVFLNAFLRHIAPNSHLLDVGCGTGYSTGYFVKNGMVAEGIDLSSSMIEIARRNYPKLQFTVADMRIYQPKDMVDAVWAGYCLFHLEQEDFENTIKKIRGYLKPRGIFGLVMQEGEGELDADEALLPGEKIYINLHSEEEMKETLKKNGFEIIDIQRKSPKYEMEFPYNKLLFIAK